MPRAESDGISRAERDVRLGVTLAARWPRLARVEALRFGAVQKRLERLRGSGRSRDAWPERRPLPRRAERLSLRSFRRPLDAAPDLALPSRFALGGRAAARSSTSTTSRAKPGGASATDARREELAHAELVQAAEQHPREHLGICGWSRPARISASKNAVMARDHAPVTLTLVAQHALLTELAVGI